LAGGVSGEPFSPVGAGFRLRLLATAGARCLVALPALLALGDVLVDRLSLSHSPSPGAQLALDVDAALAGDRETRARSRFAVAMRAVFSVGPLRAGSGG